MKNNKRLLQLVLVLAIALGSFSSFQSESKAAYTDYVLTYWEVLTNQYTRVESNHQYTTLYVRNGYTYKETNKNITSIGERLLGNSRYAYTRTYSVY